MRDEFRSVPSDTDATSGSDLTLRCSPPRGNPAPVVKWVKDGEVMDLTSDRRVSIGGQGQGQHDLSIRDARASDRGRYQCSAENVAGRRLSRPVRVRVNGELSK